MEAILALTLDIRNSPFQAYTLMQAFPVDWEFQSGDMIDFLLVRVRTKYTLKELANFKYKKALNIAGEIPADEIAAQKIQAINWNDNRVPNLLIAQVLTKPNLDRVIDMDSLLVDAPQEQWFIMPHYDEGE